MFGLIEEQQDAYHIQHEEKREVVHEQQRGSRFELSICRIHGFNAARKDLGVAEFGSKVIDIQQEKRPRATVMPGITLICQLEISE